jgi:cell division protein FtsQ
MKRFKKVFTIIALCLCLAVGIFGIISATMNQGSKRCKAILIKIKNNSSQVLVSKQDVQKWATNYGNEPLEGKVIRNIDLKKIERKVIASGYMRSCEAYFDVKGNINIETETYQPIARVLLPGLSNDRLMDKSGVVFPMSARFSPTLLLIGGEYMKDFQNRKIAKNTDLIAFLNFIENDSFWKAQITQISIDKNKEITLYPHMGEQKVLFGKPERIEAKFDKLLSFYESILPMSQWSNFKTISLKYESQIVCN